VLAGLGLFLVGLALIVAALDAAQIGLFLAATILAGVATGGVFFGSLHGTLNHLLVADRIWLKRLTGEGEHPDRLNAILFDDLHALARARTRVPGGNLTPRPSGPPAPPGPPASVRSRTRTGTAPAGSTRSRRASHRR